MKEYKHLGAYAIIEKDDKIVLINKFGGPYDGKLDLPGGTIEFGERPHETLKRELKEEIGISVNEFELIDADSVSFDWNYKGEIIKVHHIAMFYKVNEYTGEIQNDVLIDEVNDDSKGADFFEYDKLNKDNLSEIAYLQLKKLNKIK